METMQMLALQHATTLKTTHITVGDHKLNVYLAFTPHEKQIGLAYRTQLETDGMLFIYTKDTTTPYTMANTLMNLDIHWYDAQGKLTHKQTHQAGTKTAIHPTQPYRYILETPHQLLNELGEASERRIGGDENQQNSNKNFDLQVPYDVLTYANGTAT